MESITLTIKNWKKYQVRGDYKSPWWFAFHNKFWRTEKYDILTHEQKWAWICLLSHASEQRYKSSITIRVDWFCRTANVEKASFLEALKKLINLDVLECKEEICTESVQNLARISPENGSSTIKQSNNLTIKQYNNNTKNNSFRVCVEPKQVLVTTPTVIKNDLSFFINKKLLELYPQEYIDREKVKMEMWLATNGHKKPKSDRGMVRFVTGWLSRGWDQYRKALQSNLIEKKKTFEELLAEQEAKKSGSHILQTRD